MLQPRNVHHKHMAERLVRSPPSRFNIAQAVGQRVDPSSSRPCARPSCTKATASRGSGVMIRH
jgi:hypothetical protein